jgi:glycosyltransferase involved in cell wall biosynthesis
MNAPKVTVGVPVWNGAALLPRCLDALIGQTMPDIDIVISDNASTDATPEICRAFAARDPRIRVIRQPENIGAGGNFLALLRQARAPYFMWAAHDDRYMTTFIERALSALENNPTAVLAVSRVHFVDADGHDHPRLADDPNLHTVGLDPVERLRQLFTRHGWYGIYGIARPEHFALCGVDKAVFGQDVIALMHLLLLGDIVRVDEPLFEYRVERPKTAADYRKQVGESMRIELPYTNLFIALVRTVFESTWPASDKEELLTRAVLTVARENKGWRRMIGKELFGRLDKWNRRLFAARLCWESSRVLPGDTSRANSLARVARVQRGFHQHPLARRG